MTLFNLIAPNIPNFSNLAIFICHLFLDGNFNIGHILYDSRTFDNLLIFEIGTVCSHSNSILWMRTDVIAPHSSPWKPNQQTDHILQLIFFDPENLPSNIDEIEKLFTFYRLFVIPSTNEIDIHQQVYLLSKSKLSRKSLVLYQNLRRSSVCVHTITPEDTKECSNIAFDSVCTQNIDKFKNDDLFEVTFGKYQQDWIITIEQTHLIPENQNHGSRKAFKFWNGNIFVANFLFTNLNAAYINMSIKDCTSSSCAWNHKFVQQKSRKFYKELSVEYRSIDKEKL